MSHRRIYEQHYGPIPKSDEEGRPFHIHHINGDHLDNKIENLKLVTVQEHYNIHYSQGDWAAASRLMSHLTESVEELSRVATEMNLKRVSNGTHPFSGGEVQRKRLANGTHNFITAKGKAISQQTQKTLINAKKHNFQKEGVTSMAGLTGVKSQLENKTHISFNTEYLSKLAIERIQAGTHNLLGLNQKRIESGAHNFLKKVTCEWCGKQNLNTGLYGRWHGNNCKLVRV